MSAAETRARRIMDALRKKTVANGCTAEEAATAADKMKTLEARYPGASQPPPHSQPFTTHGPFGHGFHVHFNFDAFGDAFYKNHAGRKQRSAPPPPEWPEQLPIDKDLYTVKVDGKVYTGSALEILEVICKAHRFGKVLEYCLKHQFDIGMRNGKALQADRVKALEHIVSADNHQILKMGEELSTMAKSLHDVTIERDELREQLKRPKRKWPIFGTARKG